MRNLLTMFCLIILATSCGENDKRLLEINKFNKRCIELSKYLKAEDVTYRYESDYSGIVCKFRSKKALYGSFPGYIIEEGDMDHIISILHTLRFEGRLDEKVDDFITIE